MARSYRVAVVAVVVLAAVALCAQAWAQPGPGGPPRGPRPGGFGMGFGGFGMMGGGPGGAFSIATTYAGLLNAPSVLKDLELVDDQKAKLKEANEKNQTAMREVFSGMGNMRDMSEEERKTKMGEVGKKMQAQAEAAKKTIEEILLPHQLERLKGIALQRVGTAALNDKQIQQDLKLSEDQVAKLKSIGEDSNKKMQEMFAGMRDLSPEERREKMNEMGQKMQEMRKQAETKLVDVLTDEQKASLEKMKGEKLEIPESELRPRGFGPGGGGPGGPGGGDRRRPAASKAD